MWEKVVSIASSIEFPDEDDSLIWQFNYSNIYSSQSLYSVINFRGVVPAYVLAVWKLIILRSQESILLARV
jgi:hypothetical protein